MNDGDIQGPDNPNFGHFGRRFFDDTRYRFVMLILLFVSLAMNLMLARKVSSLKNDLKSSAQDRQLRVGAKVPPLEGISMDGSTKLIKYDEVKIPTVIYFFTPQCRWCKRNLPSLHTLVDNANSKYRIVGVSLTSKELSEYVNREHLSSMSILAEPTHSVREAYRSGATPETVVVSPEGYVQRVWFGAYENSLRADIEQYFQVKLPGCCTYNGN